MNCIYFLVIMDCIYFLVIMDCQYFLVIMDCIYFLVIMNCIFYFNIIVIINKRNVDSNEAFEARETFARCPSMSKEDYSLAIGKHHSSTICCPLHLNNDKQSSFSKHRVRSEPKLVGKIV